MNHEHIPECDHEMKHCAPCDVAFCAKCEREWPPACQQAHWEVTYDRVISVPYTYIGDPLPEWNHSTTVASSADAVIQHVWGNHADCIYDGAPA